MSLVFYSLRGFLKTHTHLQENLYIGLFLFGGHVLTSRRINLFAYLGLNLTKGNMKSWKRGFFPAIRTSCARPRQLTPVPWCILRIATFKMRPWANWKLKRKKLTSCFPWRIHGTGIFTYTWMVDFLWWMLVYIPYMDPIWSLGICKKRHSDR